MNQPPIFIFHGYGGKRSPSWQEWLELELYNKGHHIIYPNFPDSKNPSINKWDESFIPYKNYLQSATMITYSMGGIFALYLINKYHIHIEKLILVALPKNIIEGRTLEGLLKKISNKEKENLTRFIEQPIDWNLIQKCCQDITIILSNNDFAVPYEETKLFYEKNLPQSKIIMLHNRGHFNYKHEVITLPEVLKLI